MTLGLPAPANVLGASAEKPQSCGKKDASEKLEAQGFSIISVLAW